jgi:hypothetical protein
MHKKAAVEILAIAHGCTVKTTQSLEFAKSHCDDDEYKEYRRFVGQIMAHIFLNILVPIYEEHKDLAPDWYKAYDNR